MIEAIIGADGFIGSALALKLPDAIRTTRRFQPEQGRWPFDLMVGGDLPVCDVAYLCAGINGNLICARFPQESWRTNVDGTIHVAEHFAWHGAFLVWISSTTVEWSTDIYGTQRRITEGILRTMPHVGIIRAGRVTRENVSDLCGEMIRIGRNRIRGVTLWGEDEKPYAK